MTPTRRISALVLALAICLAPAAPAIAQDNTAIAINTRDGSSLFRLAFSIRPVMQSVVDDSNAAVAYSNCTDCRTVAIAFQVLLLMGDVDSLTSENLALAVNQDCTACETFAAAYQLIFGTGEIVRLSPDGRRTVNDIRLSLRGLQDEELSPDELAVRLDELRDELKQVLVTELIPVGGGQPQTADADREERSRSGESDAAASEESTPTPSPSSSGTPTPTGTPTGTPTPGSTPTPTPDATATAAPQGVETPTATPDPTP